MKVVLVLTLALAAACSRVSTRAGTEVGTRPGAQSGRQDRSIEGFPRAVVAETKSLDFHVAAPVTGSLDAQIRAQLGELLAKDPRATLRKLRVFAVGPSALVSSRSIIARLLREERVALPALSLVGVAAFPDSTQLVEIESTASGRRPTNPFGVAFIAGVASPSGERTIGGLSRVARESGVAAASVLRISCFYEELSQVAAAKSALATTFPGTEASFVRSYASSAHPAIECEGVARLTAAAVPDVRYVNLVALPPSANYAHATLVSTPSVLLTGTELAAGAGEAPMREMFDTLAAAADHHGARLSDVVMGDNYWLTDSARDGGRVVRARYFGGTVPAATGVFFTSLADSGAVLALELVVAIGREHVDTVTIAPGSRLVDGRFMQPHRAALTQTVTKDRQVVRSRSYTLTKSIVDHGSSSAYHLELKASADAPDTSVRADMLLDLRTLALIRREEWDGTGRRSLVEFEGTRVHGAVRPAAGGEPLPFDVTLPREAFSSLFLDAAVNATTLRQGMVVRVPAFDIYGQRREVQWHDFTVAQRDTIRVQGVLKNAWLVEERAGGPFPPRRLWLLREPPYFPLDITWLPDGSTLRAEQRLIP